MTALQRPAPDILAAELEKLPQFTTDTPAELDPLRIALAVAVASGQDADQLAKDLGTPPGWENLDPTRIPAPPAGGITAPVPAAEAKGLPQPVPPDWIGKVVPIALASTDSLRVAVLNGEPTALGGLERPPWARAMKPSATYGPISVTGTDLNVTSTKWIQVFQIIETVQVINSVSTVLCVVKVAVPIFGPPLKQLSVLAGSAWVAAHPLCPPAPADGFAGITIQSGELSCDQVFTLGAGTLNVPAGATLTLSLTATPSPAGAPGAPAKVTAPTTFTFVFPAFGTPTVSMPSYSATILGESFVCTQGSQPNLYNPGLKVLYVPGLSAATVFNPAPTTSKLFHLFGSAPIQTLGWGFNVSEAGPTALGDATDPGVFALAFLGGISCQWTGPKRREPAAGGTLIAQNTELLLFTISGVPPGVVLQQSFKLWDDQDTANQRRCQLIASRFPGQTLLYATDGKVETVQYSALLDAIIDRPIMATGSRIPTVFLVGVVTLTSNAAGNRLLVLSATPDPQTGGGKKGPVAYPMGLDNALLQVSVPLSLLITAKADANFDAPSGDLITAFGYFVEALYLPDPYAGAIEGGANNPTAGAPGAFMSGFLLAGVAWTTPAAVAFRLEDTAHPHPVLPPASEASTIPILPGGPPSQLSRKSEEPTSKAASLATSGAAGLAAFKPADVAPPPPPPPPLPAPESGILLLDLSTRASQLGVELFTTRSQYSIDGLSVRGPAFLLPLFTLPALAWEPMYDQAPFDPASPTDRLLFPPDDGPLTQVRSTSATLIPVSPLQSLGAVITSGTGGFTAQLTLPFGLVGVLDSTTATGTILPNLSLVMPVFPAKATPAGTIYTGAWQMSFAAPDPTQPNPVLAGRSYLRTFLDNPTPPGLSYGEEVLGRSVADIFSSRFDANAQAGTTGVPLRRYDLTGYGASMFSEWTNTSTTHSTDVIKAHFHAVVGRTSHEVIQVQSIIYPWAIKVVRTITIDRENSGSVLRFDSGWQPASDGLFDFPADITPAQVHHGIIGGLIQVKNIQELGFPVVTTGTQDGTSVTGPVTLQPVTFDAEVIIQPQHLVLQGASTLKDLQGNQQICVPSTGITGFIGTTAFFHLSMQDLANFSAFRSGAGGPIGSVLNLGNSNSLLRTISFDANAVDDGLSNGLGLVCAVRGIPKLSSDGAWSVAARKQNQTAPTALGPTQPAPVVQPNDATNNPGSDIHFADPQDIFRLAAGSSNPPNTFYGFLQGTGTQSNFLSRPFLTVGSQQLALGDTLNVAHAGALLGAVGGFPDLSSCLQFLQTELQTIENKLADQSLATTQSIFLQDAVREKPVSLIRTSIANADLYFYWSQDDPTKKPAQPNVQISLGQPSPAPSWSLDINRVAVGLTIPAVTSTPLLWLQGALHADANTLPSFPGLQVVFAGPLQPLTSFFTLLQSLQSVLPSGTGGGGGGAQSQILRAHAAGDDTGPGLDVHFSDGKLTVSDSFQLPTIPLGPGFIEDISLDIGTTIDVLALSIDFLVGIGSPDAPCHWIVDPLAGTICLQAGVVHNQLDILIQAGIGLGLAIDLGIASGGASIVIAVQIQVQGSTVTLLFLLTGQAEVDVLGGLASAAITMTAGLGLSFNVSDPLDANLIGTASVGIHISICWVVNINWSGSWTFQKEINLKQIA
jgi:hypothetical protein